MRFRFQTSCIVLIAVVVGCGGETSSQSASAPPIKRATEPAPQPGGQSVDPAQAQAPQTAPPEMLQGVDLAEAILSAEVLTEIPDDAPKDLPLHPDMEILSVTDDPANGAIAYHAKVPGDLESVTSRYKAMAEDGGWSLEREQTQNPLTLFAYTKGEARMNITIIAESDDAQQVSLTRLESLNL